MHRLEEDGFWELRDGDEGCGVLETGSVVLGAEDVDCLVVGGAEGFHALVGLLTIVEAGGHAMDTEERGGDESWFGPLAGLDAVVRFDVAVDCGRCLLADGGVKEGFKYITCLRERGIRCLTSRLC